MKSKPIKQINFSLKGMNSGLVFQILFLDPFPLNRSKLVTEWYFPVGSYFLKISKNFNVSRKQMTSLELFQTRK